MESKVKGNMKYGNMEAIIGHRVIGGVRNSSQFWEKFKKAEIFVEYLQR